MATFDLVFASSLLSLLVALRFNCLQNVIFASLDASTPYPNISSNDCFCLGSTTTYSGLNYFSSNRTCQLFYNFTTNFRLINNTKGTFCFTGQPPALISNTSTVLSSTQSTIKTSVRTTTLRQIINSTLQWNSVGVTIATGNGNSDMLNPFGVFVDNQYYIYVAEKGNDRVSKWRPHLTGPSSPTFQSGPSELNQPPSLYVVSATGTIYVADELNRRVRSFAGGSTTGSNVPRSVVGSAPNVNGLYLDPNGTIFVTDSSNHRIYNWKTNATVAGGNGAGNNANQFDEPKRFFIDKDFSFYIADSNNHRVQKWTLGASEGQTVAGGNGPGNGSHQLRFPLGVVVSSQGDIIVCDSGNNRIQRWHPSEKTGKTIAENSASNSLRELRGIAIDNSDNIYVADGGNLRIQKFRVS